MTEPIARIEAALAGLGAEHEPPAGWEARVLAATAPRTRTWPRWWWLCAPIGAIAGLVFWLVPEGTQQLALVVALDSGPVVRGSAARQGQVMHVTATGGGAYREIRIYRDDVLEVVCPRDLACRGAEGADLKLDRTGSYQVVALASSSPIPPPSPPSDASHPGTLDKDLASASRAGVEIQQRGAILVR